MAARRHSNQDTTPAAPQAGTPSPVFSGHQDHSFTLQAVMEMQKSLGQLTGEITALTNSVDKLDTKVSKLDEKLSGVTHKVYAAGVVISILVLVGGFFVNKAWDMAASHLADLAKAAIQQTSAIQSPPTLQKK